MRMNFLLALLMTFTVACSHTKKDTKTPVPDVVTEVPAPSTDTTTETPTTPSEPKPEEKPVETVVGDITKEGEPKVDHVDELKTGETVEVAVIKGQSKNKGDVSVLFGNTKYPFIVDAAKIANCILNKKEFFDRIAKHKPFNYTDHKPAVVAQKLEVFTPVIMRTYCKKLTSTLGYRNVGENQFYVNICKRYSLSADLVKTVLHERSHVVGFGHQGNSNNAFNRGTVPYAHVEVIDATEALYPICKKEAGIK